MDHRKKPINKTLLLMIVLIISFLAALSFYFVNSFITTEYESAVYSTMEEPSLPVVYAFCSDLEINPMKGYFQDMGNEAADTVTPLPEDRRLEIRIHRYGKSVVGVSYEIRNLSLDHFIERSKAEDFDRTEQVISAVLPIQNLIEKDCEYLLSITVDTGEEKVNYYTRILWSDHSHAAEMLNCARDFTLKTFDSEESKDLTVYMETDPKTDNTNLGLVTIGSAFSQLTWGGTGMRLASEPLLYLRSCSGIMGAVEVSYRTKMTVPAGDEEFTNTDEFTMRLGSERMYIMNYQRNTYEVFNGSKHRFAGKKIMLGITDKSALSTAESDSGEYIAFRTDKELWCYNQKTQEAVNIFSFRSKRDDGVRSGWRDHQIKILSVEDDGTVDFAVYGYMNRGRHEGYNGLVYYRYSQNTGSTTECFFAPFAKSEAKISLELEELCSKGGGDLFYFKQNETVIAIDLKSLEMMEVVSGLKEETYMSDEAQTRFAWLENGRYDSASVRIMNISTGATETMNAEEDSVILLLCFCGSDLVIGKARTKDTWKIGKRVRSLPMYRIEIYDDTMNKVMDYEKTNQYIDDFRKDSNRFLLNLYEKNTESGYVQTGSDTIVCAEVSDYTDIGRIGSSNSSDKQTVFHVGIDNEIKNTKKLKILVPDSVSYESSGNVEIRAVENSNEVQFMAWANGRLQGITTDFKNALSMCYDQMGWITEKNGEIIYNRTDRSNYYTVKEPLLKAKPVLAQLDEFEDSKLTEDGYLMIDAYGTELNQVLGFVYKDCPVVWMNPDGRRALIFGYDAKTVKFLYFDADGSASGETKTYTREEASEMCSGKGADYICYRQKKQQ